MTPSATETLSVIVPLKDERDNLRILHARIAEALTPVLGRLINDYEVVFVDDGSTDGSDRILADIARIDPRTRVVRLRRNFGQTPALQAGIDHSLGSLIATLDGDLQNDPADLPAMIEQLQADPEAPLDAVFGERARRQDALIIRKIPSRIANWLIRYVTGSPIRDMGCTIRVFRRDLAESLPLYGEMHRFIPVLCLMHGARIIQIPVRHHARIHGQTKYNLTRTFRVILDLITIKFLSSFVTRPMHLMGGCGLASLCLGLIFLITAIVMKSTSGIFLTGNPFLLLSALMVMVAFQFFSMGLLGELLTRTYFESTRRRAYTVRSTQNLPLKNVPQEHRRAA
ncbi:MAG: glycosyltransferase family 2 protein [Planctomycetota bacterium]|nr:glycosyltransferase family 2 protein [Planctomycetota bacterium]